jgi:phosphoribosylaminoimidazolecarboxamide formyltransferase/IMP cyclohydrolase
MAVKSRNIPAPEFVTIKRALLSLSDKSGLEAFAKALHERGVELISTGGTAKSIASFGLPVKDVSEVTGFPEIMDGRVKTLHPSVHGALLGIRDDADHQAAMSAHNITPIDLVAINLYPFEETLNSGASDADIIENIDIGGPAMLRASAKNHAYVSVATDPTNYDEIIAAMDANNNQVPLALRQKLAQATFAKTAAYDAMISNWFAKSLEIDTPPQRAFGGTLQAHMRYGENPHQWAAFYKNEEQRHGVASAKQVQGKQLSYNNFNDTDAAYELVAEFNPTETAAIAIIKHANPCGVASANTLVEAYEKALACDPVSAFGGIIAANQPLDAATAEEIVKIFTEVIIAPGASDEAKAIIAAKKNLRLLLTDGLPDPKTPSVSAKTIAGGLLVQARDNGAISRDDLKVVTKRAPSEQEMTDMLLAFKIAKHVKSNAIIYVKDGATVGIGAGQMSRIDSTRIAAQKAKDAAEAAGNDTPLTKGSVVASDAFFPFADGLLAAAEAGATAIIQPGGSMRDDDVIKAADEAGIAMVFTGMRHFRH